MEVQAEFGCPDLQDFHQASRMIGSFLSSVLGGIILCQTFNYYRTSTKNRDRCTWWFVAVVVSFVASHTIIQQAILFQVDLGDAIAVCRAVRIQSLATLFLSGVVAIMCQLWLLYRVWVVSEGNRLTAAVGGLLWLAGIALSLTAFILFYVRRNTSWALQGLPLWISLISFSSAITELYLATAFVAFALTRRRTVLDVRLGSMLDSLAALTLQACWLPALSCLLTALILVTSPNSEIYLIPIACTPSLYCISVLFTLNSRDIIQDKAEKKAALYTMPSIPNLNYSSTAVFASGEPITPSDSEFSSHQSAKQARDRVGVRSIDFVVDVEQRVDLVEELPPPVDPRLYHDWGEPALPR